MGRFEVDVAEELGNSTYPPAGGDGSPPLVRFAVSEDRLAMTATPPGAAIACTLRDDGASRVIIEDAREHAADMHIALIDVHPAPGCDNVTEETIAIASAIYWSWWRACRMRGETMPTEVQP